MYSILKSQRRKLKHSQSSPITCATFLTNSIAIFCFANSAYMIANLPSQSSDQILQVCFLPDSIPAYKCERLLDRQCIIIASNCRYVYHLKITIQNKMSIQKLQQPSYLSLFYQTNSDPYFLNASGCTFELFTFNTGDFIIKTQVYEEKMFYLTIYHRKIVQNVTIFEVQNKQWALHSGNYILDLVDKARGKMAYYKQNQIDEVDWNVKFVQCIKGQSKSQQKSITLPNKFLHEKMQLIQIISWLDHHILFLAFDEHNQVNAFIWNFKEDISAMQPYHKLQLSNQFNKILYTDPSLGIFYTLSFVHNRINGQLYENSLQVSSMNSLQTVQRGYCNLKQINISPDGKKILDYCTEYRQGLESLYHIRLLLQKKSLYMFLLQKSEQLSDLQHNFRQMILNCL